MALESACLYEHAAQLYLAAAGQAHDDHVAAALRSLSLAQQAEAARTRTRLSRGAEARRQHAVGARRAAHAQRVAQKPRSDAAAVAAQRRQEYDRIVHGGNAGADGIHG